MKLSVTVLPLFLAASMALPTPTNSNELSPRFEGSNLLDALVKSGGSSELVKNLTKDVKIPVKAGGLKGGTKAVK
ncbi:hypothetical protein BDV28DRAFT_150491 [Aspergillus coremiiformis]|uniref:Uncharacterized protein n=1 Tax=Aspergillus coremiiformis TaxID=138285 RepID=A0A5N6YZQ4_9EURO|nr:hypothetical protein BDV28DRAFT_150491 [Aspergillus coremiiformis]